MRKPRVKNKYNLTIPQIRKLVIKDRSQVCAPLFWRNDVISAWCISGHAGSKADERFSTDNEYWIGIYDEDSKAYKGKFRFEFSTYGGMCGYVNGGWQRLYRSPATCSFETRKQEEITKEDIDALL